MDFLVNLMDAVMNGKNRHNILNNLPVIIIIRLGYNNILQIAALTNGP